MTFRICSLSLAVAVAATACSEPPAPSSQPLVVATFYPLYEFSRQVAGDRAEVVSLVPAGVEPHEWEPSPQDLMRVKKSRLFVYNGAGFEPWVDKFLNDLAGKGPVVVKATEGLRLLSAERLRRSQDQDQDKNKRLKDAQNEGTVPLNGHVWLDPVLAASQVNMIRDGLVRADPANATTYADNARSFTAKLADLNEAFERGLKECARRDIVVSHAAFGYLASRYRLSMVPVMGMAPEFEPSPARMASVIRVARQRNVKYIFFETLVSPKLAETLAREIGAQTLVLNPIEGLTQEEAAAGKGYLALMEDNLKNLRTALECR